MSTATNQSEANVDQQEIRKFDELASRWWDPEGEFKPLHRLNPLRTRYVAERANLQGAKAVDVGCGGGLLSEALAKNGAEVTGIDMAPGPLAVARLHQHKSELGDIRYLLNNAESLAAEEPGCFDVVTCMEVMEHVPDPASLITACTELTKPGGNLFFSTLNRTPKGFLLGIVGAEYVMNMLPKGTHEYEKFIRPSELRRWAVDAGLEFVDICGITYQPLNGQFRLSDDVDVNYLMHFTKPA